MLEFKCLNLGYDSFPSFLCDGSFNVVGALRFSVAGRGEMTESGVKEKISFCSSDASDGAQIALYIQDSFFCRPLWTGSVLGHPSLTGEE